MAVECIWRFLHTVWYCTYHELNLNYYNRLVLVWKKYKNIKEKRLNNIHVIVSLLKLVTVKLMALCTICDCYSAKIARIAANYEIF